MEKIIDKVKKAKENQLKVLQKEIFLLNEEIAFYENRNKEIEKYIKSIDKTKYNNVIELLALDNYIQSLLKEKKKNLNKIENLKEKIDKIIDEMKYILGEKKAIEKYSEKIKKQKQRKELQKQVQITDEIFNRKFIY